MSTRHAEIHRTTAETDVVVSMELDGSGTEPMTPMIGTYDTELTEEFLRAFSFHAGITLHVKILYGKNSHHRVEAVFKALAHALRIAIEKDARAGDEIPSTKGLL